MKGIVGYLVGAAVLAVFGALFLAIGALEREIAHSQQRLATLHFDAPAETFERAERYFEYGSRIPWIGSGPLNDIRARRAALQYWRQEYDGVVPGQEDPMTAVPADNVDLQLVVASALYRIGQAQAKDRTTTIQALDVGADAFLSVLKNASRNEDAAHNYEFLVRLRDEVTRNKRKPGLAVRDRGTPLGLPGTLAKESAGSNFKVYVPLEAEEREKADADAKKLEGQKNQTPDGGNAGKAAPRGRKG